MAESNKVAIQAAAVTLAAAVIFWTAFLTLSLSKRGETVPVVRGFDLSGFGKRFDTSKFLVKTNSSVGVYYINHDERVDQETYMASSLQMIRQDGNFKRVGAVDRDEEQLLALLAAHKRPSQVKELCAAEDLAKTLSHLKAIALAYQDGAEAAVILEDDATFFLVPYWAKTLEQLFESQKASDPDWDVVRLMYTLRSAELERVLWQWKFETDDRPPTMPAEENCCYGTVANLYSRKWLRSMYERYINLEGGPERDGDPASRYTFNLDVDSFPQGCAFDTAVLSALPSRQYLATPPLFTHRLSQSFAQKPDAPLPFSDKLESHVQSFIFAFRWHVEAHELQFSGPEEITQHRWKPERNPLEKSLALRHST
eukprot:Selendium_serpulae@DN673_c0_g1_i1.p1